MSPLQWVLVSVLVVCAVGVAIFGWQICRSIRAMHDPSESP